MAVKTLKISFPNFFSTLTNHKLIFVICKSVSVITVPPSFLIQSELIWLSVLSSNYWSLQCHKISQNCFFFLMFSNYWFFLNTYHIILTFVVPMLSVSNFKLRFMNIQKCYCYYCLFCIMALHIFIITFFKNNFSSRKINLKFLFIVRMLIVLTVFAQD